MIETEMVAVVDLETVVADLAAKVAAITRVEDSVGRAQALVAGVVVASAATGMTEARTISKLILAIFRREPMNRPSKTVLTNHADRKASKSLCAVTLVHQNLDTSNSTHNKSLTAR